MGARGTTRSGMGETATQGESFFKLSIAAATWMDKRIVAAVSDNAEHHLCLRSRLRLLAAIVYRGPRESMSSPKETLSHVLPVSTEALPL